MQIYPTLQRYWAEKRLLLNQLFEFHDVSKHRETIYSGGQLRSDPPPGFFESLGVADGDSGKVLYCPHMEIILRYDPKAPRSERISAPREDHVMLEKLTVDCMEFLQRTGEFALNDSRANIELSFSEFQKPSDEASAAP